MTLPALSADTAVLEYAPPPVPHRQAARIAALHAYDILDTPVEAAFEDITRIAAHVCGVPIAVVNLIDAGRQWFKSEIGLGVRETPLATSICAHAILEADFLEVPDTTDDARFRGNPLVTGEPGLRFYAGALLKSPDGHALGTVCVLDTQPRLLDEEQRRVLRGLARQVMAHLELRRALKEMRETDRFRTRLMSVAGHDLRQPLSVITAVIDEVRRAPGGQHEESLQMAAQAAEELAADLTLLANASSEQASRVSWESIELAEVLGDVRDTWLYPMRRKDLALDVGTTQAVVVSDRAMLRTMLDNLVGNALKYTASGGISVTVVESERHVAIRVTDTGIGIADAHRSAVFDAFRQLDPASDGLGLGLSIVRRNAELLGCDISLESVPAAGSCFEIRLPRELVVA